MSSTIIGTAGHVDHGKTMLIKALTGTDTDRLKEEKARGITIELGFAYLTLPGGGRCGIIDVPGHEKFVRNMLAGAGSIDLALFVVAADEGIMPQSREHLEILTLLNISRGVIALTKTDLVEADWLEMVTMDIRDEVKGTFLENAPIIPVSAKTGDGMDTLKKCLFDIIEGIDEQYSKTGLAEQSEKSLKTGLAEQSEKNIKTEQLNQLNKSEEKSNQAYLKIQKRDGKIEKSNIPFRLPIDRVFTVEGFGTVITGTLTEGRLAAGAEVMLYPSMIRAKARSLQVHSQNVAEAHRGQRVAVNLSGIKNEDVQKGCVIAEAGSMQISDILDVRLDVVKSTGRKLVNNSRLHLYHGTTDVTCRLVLIDNCESGLISGGKNAKTLGGINPNQSVRDGLSAGESGYAQLRTETPIAAKAGDRFVVRFYSPMETVGGGVILDPNPAKRSRNENVAEIFRIKEKGDFAARLACFILDKSKNFPRVLDLKLNPFSNSAEFDGTLQALSKANVVFVLKDSVIHRDYLAVLSEKCRAILKDFHTKNPLSDGMRRDELRSKLLPKASQQNADGVLELLRQSGTVNIDGTAVSDGNFKVALTDIQRKMTDEIIKIYAGAGFAPPSEGEIAEKYSKDQRVYRQVIERLIAKGELIVLDSQIMMHNDYYVKAIAVCEGFKKEFTLAEFRDAIATSRKYAVALLEYFDNKGITKKTGDVRVFLAK